jgi:hypothetical protein
MESHSWRYLGEDFGETFREKSLGKISWRYLGESYERNQGEDFRRNPSGSKLMLSNRYALGETFTLPSLQAVRYRSHLRERESEVFGESIVGRRREDIRETFIWNSN